MRLAVANVYVGNKRRPAFRDRMRATRAAVLAVCEAQRLGQIDGYHRHGAPGHQDRFTRETAVYTRAGVTVESVRWATLTEAVGGYAHARTVVETRLRHGWHRWAVIEVHANPGRAGRPAEQNTRLMAGVLAIALEAIAAGYLVVVAGDFNRRRHETGPDSPTWLSEQLGGTVRLAGVDGIVTGPGVRVTRFRRRRRPPGSDHPLVVATVVPGR